MHRGAEFLEDELWYGWDSETEKYWAWSDEANDWVEWTNPDGDSKATDTSAQAAAAASVLDGEIFYVTSEDTYYYKGGLIEYDQEWEAFYYYTNPDDADQYDWLPENADFEKSTEVSTIDVMYAKMDGSYVEEAVPSTLSPSATIVGTIKLADDGSLDVECEKPDLYYDGILECYFYLELQVHHKKKTDSYYVIDRLRKEAVPIPDEAADTIKAGIVAVWPPAEIAHEEETQPSSPEADKIQKPVNLSAGGPPAGTLFKMKENDLQIYNRGANIMTEEGSSTSLFSEDLRDVYNMSRWGEYLVGRCRRTFGMLITDEVKVSDIMGRLPELIGLVQHLNVLQMLMIWKHNCSSTKWADASEEAIRNFAFKIERTVPTNVVARCALRGFNLEEGASCTFVKKYSPKDQNRVEIVEKTQEFLRSYEETHIKNMGRVIILIHGMVDAEPKLKQLLETSPWWLLPTKDGDAKDKRVYYNYKTLQAFSASDIKTPASAVKLVCIWQAATSSNGLFVCKAN